MKWIKKLKKSSETKVNGNVKKLKKKVNNDSKLNETIIRKKALLSINFKTD